MAALIACCDKYYLHLRFWSHAVTFRRISDVSLLPEVPIRISTDNFQSWLGWDQAFDELGHKENRDRRRRIELSPHAHRVEGFRKAMQESGLRFMTIFPTGSLSSGHGLCNRKAMLALSGRPTHLLY